MKTSFGGSNKSWPEQSLEDGLKMEISDLRRGVMYCLYSENKGANVTAQQTCAFVFEKAKIRFSHDVAHLKDRLL